MANETTTKTRAKRSVAEPVAAVAAEPKINAPIVVKEIDPNQIIVVRNGFHGNLIYVSPRTGEKFTWSEFGDDQEIELRELRNAKSSKRAFFENNWFMFDEEYAWVISYLGVDRYYKNAIPIESFDDVFSKSPAEIEKTIAKLSDGQKKSVMYRAKELISNGEIDSNKAISALEKALGVELVER